MSPYLNDLNIIDLISEKHAQLRRMIRDTWAEQGNPPITDTESYILALLQRQPMTVSQLAKIIDISRQGTHKCAQSLVSREYILVQSLEGNSRNKILVLSPKGLLFCNQTLVIKEKFEQDIKNTVGEDTFVVLKNVLKEKWF